VPSTPDSNASCEIANKSLIRVFVVDDHPIVSEVLSEMLNQSGEFTVVGSASNGEAAVRLLDGLSVDIVLLDLILPEMCGLEVFELLQIQQPEAKVVMCSGSGSDEAIVEAYARGVSAYVEKSIRVEELFSTLRAVAQGKFPLNPWMSGLVADFVRRRNLYKPLAPADLHILRLLAAGRTVKEIAEELGISVSGTYKARSRIRSRMNIKGAGGFFEVALRLGLVNPATAALAQAARRAKSRGEGVISS